MWDFHVNICTTFAFSCCQKLFFRKLLSLCGLAQHWLEAVPDDPKEGRSRSGRLLSQGCLESYEITYLFVSCLDLKNMITFLVYTMVCIIQYYSTF